MGRRRCSQLSWNLIRNKFLNTVYFLSNGIVYTRVVYLITNNLRRHFLNFIFRFYIWMPRRTRVAICSHRIISHYSNVICYAIATLTTYFRENFYFCVFLHISCFSVLKFRKLIVINLYCSNESVFEAFSQQLSLICAISNHRGIAKNDNIREN